MAPVPRTTTYGNGKIFSFPSGDGTATSSSTYVVEDTTQKSFAVKPKKRGLNFTKHKKKAK